MARPQKEGLDYFPHDVDASGDPKIEPLIILYGSKGYAFYFLHLEYIYRSPDLTLDVSDAETRQIFCSKLNITQDEYQQILNTAIRHRCFDKELFSSTGQLSSHGIKKRAAIVLKKRLEMQAKYQEKIKKLAGISAAETKEEKAAETPQSKVKKSKGKESKVSIILKEEGEEEKKKKAEGDIFKFFNLNISPITPFQSETISQYLDDGLEPEMILAVLQDSSGKDDIWAWIKTVLNNSVLQNIKTLEQYEAKKAQKENKKKRAAGGGGNAGTGKRNPGDDGESISGIGIEV